jgi:hypothetical protein
MNRGIQLRQKLLESADEILEMYSGAALGKRTFDFGVDEARREVWDTLKAVILSADDPSPMAALTDGSISNRIDAVLADVAAGKLTPAEGKRVMSLLQAGFEMTELAELVTRLEAVEKAK